MGVCLLYCFLLPVSGEILWHDAGDDSPFTFSLTPDGRPTRLRLANGRRVRPGQVSGLYGAPGGMRVLDGGTDVCSRAWAEARNFTRTRRVLYQDLSDRAGWRTAKVPSGIVALDPRTGRLKFSEGDPDQPLQLVSHVPLPHGELVGIALKERFAFLARRESDRCLQVIDIGNPLRPAEIASVRIGDSLGSPQLQGDLFAFLNHGELTLLDISNIERPRRLYSFFAGPMRAIDAVRLCGGVLYLRDSFRPHLHGFRGHAARTKPDSWQAYDISSPSHPELLGTVEKGTVPDVVHRGAAFRRHGHTLQLLDLADPARPTVERTFRLPGRIDHLCASEDRLYALLHTRRLAVVFVGRRIRTLLCVTPALPGLIEARSICAHGKNVFISSWDPRSRAGSVIAHDLSNPFRPGTLATISGRAFVPAQVVADGTRLAVADRSLGLWTLDIDRALARAKRSPDRRIQVISRDDDRSAQNQLHAGLWPCANGGRPLLHLRADAAIVSTQPARSMAILGLEDPPRPALRGSVRQRGNEAPLFFADSLLFLKDQRDRSLRALDFADPLRPRSLGKLRLRADGPYVSVGRHGYLVTSRKGKEQNRSFLSVFDLSDPVNPFAVVSAMALPLGFGGPGLRLLAATPELCLLRKGGLAVVDVSDPFCPKPGGRLDDPEISIPERTGFGRYNGLLYLLGSESVHGYPRLLIYDVSDPGEPVKVNSFPLFAVDGKDTQDLALDEPFAGELLVEGDFLYVVGLWGGVRVYGFKPDPLQPEQLDHQIYDFDRYMATLPEVPEANGAPEVPGLEEIGDRIGAVHRDHLVRPTLSGLGIYKVRRSPERPTGPLALEFVRDSERFDKVVRHVRTSMLALNEASAAAIVIRRKGRTLLEWYHGKHSWAPDARAVDEESRFPIWSLTKVYVTTALGLALDAGRAELGDPVCKFIPEFTGKGKEKITLRQLATHSSGLKGDIHWLEFEPWAPPGTVASYSNVGMDLLAFTVGKIMQEGGFGQTLRERIFEPLGLDHSGFLCPGDDKTLIIPAVTTRQAEPWYDEWGPDGKGMAGLYVSARDLAAFGELYLGEGELNGKRILRPSTIRLLSSPRQAPGKLADAVPWQALAWRVQGNWRLDEQSRDAPDGTFSHSGGTHCYIMVCPALDLVAVKLLNRGYWPHTFDFNGDYRCFCRLVLEAARKGPGT